MFLTPAQPSDSERRDPGDRRRSSTPRISRYSLFGGRRRGPRREEEREGSFVDRYDRPLVFILAWVAIANVADSFFTLHHLQAGGIELNPIAEELLRAGHFGFVSIKCALISMALMVLLMHKNFAAARFGIWISGVAYTLLFAYHLILLRY
ncbi:MAG: DUF5658 family protein [Planctomycetota bacterium]|nr:DUF5658 family protein [Planctomycetota bacterium]